MTAPLLPPSGASLAPTPATAPRVARAGRMGVRNGRYFDGERSYQRVSNKLKAIETDTYHLDEWKANMLAVGLAGRPDLVLGVAAAAEFDPVTGKLTADAKSTLRGLRWQAMGAAKSKAGANQGTAVHTATERLDLGEPLESIGLPAPFDADLRAYAALKSAMGLTFRPEHIERTVRNADRDTAGTFDRIGECSLLVEQGILAPGELIIVDVKTENDPLMNLIHIAPQLAEYAHAPDVFVPEPRPKTDDDPNGPFAGRYEPMPNVSKLVGLVVHVRNGQAVPYLVDLAAGKEAADGAAAQLRRIKASKVRVGDPGSWVLPVQVPMHVQTIVEAAAARGPLGGSAPVPGMTTAEYVATADVPRASLPAAVAALRGDESSATVEARAAHGFEVGDTVTVGGIEFVKHAELPTGAELVGGHGSMPDPAAEMRRHLLNAIEDAPTREVLAALYDRASELKVPWDGEVEQAAARRFAIVECVQRAGHGHASTVGCACGFTAGLDTV